MKPILFNTEMVRAILEGRKTLTRRLVKPQPTNPRFNNIGWLGWDDGHGYKMRQPYQPGDILYVRETWAENPMVNGYAYKAWFNTENGDAEKADKLFEWRPSIHMPKEAARLFLRVTDVQVERLQEITTAECVREGIPRKSLAEVGEAFTIGQFSDLWDSTIKKADLSTCGWNANPWVWVIRFKRIGKEEATQ